MLKKKKKSKFEKKEGKKEEEGKLAMTSMKEQKMVGYFWFNFEIFISWDLAKPSSH